MNFLYDSFIFPVLVNIISPIALFLLAALVMQNTKIGTYIKNTYTTVMNGLKLNEDDEVSSAPGEMDLDALNKDKTKNELLQKISKDYGPDKKRGWEVRTFYTVAKNQLEKSEAISFKIKGHDNLNIKITKDFLFKSFNLDKEMDNISDGAGKIRIYLFAPGEDSEKQFYITRFGTLKLDDPIKIPSEMITL